MQVKYDGANLTASPEQYRGITGMLNKICGKDNRGLRLGVLGVLTGDVMPSSSALTQPEAHFFIEKLVDTKGKWVLTPIGEELLLYIKQTLPQRIKSLNENPNRFDQHYA